MEPVSYRSPSQDAIKPYSDSPIPADSEPKSYPEVVQGPRPGSIAPHSGNGIYDSNVQTQAYSYDPQWTTGNQYPAPDSERICGVKRGAFWVLLTALIALVIIVVLAGILGGVASGSIKTSSSAAVTVTTTVTAVSTASTTSSAPTVTTTTVTTDAGEVTVECPSADGLNYTVPGSSQVFKRQCNVNYFGGEGDLGLVNSTVLSIQQCLNLCASQSTCVAVNFNYLPQCWLKEFTGIKSDGDRMESAVLIQ